MELSKVIEYHSKQTALQVARSLNRLSDAGIFLQLRADFPERLPRDLQLMVYSDHTKPPCKIEIFPEWKLEDRTAEGNICPVFTGNINQLSKFRLNYFQPIPSGGIYFLGLNNKEHFIIHDGTKPENFNLDEYKTAKLRFLDYFHSSQSNVPYSTGLNNVPE